MKTLHICFDLDGTLSDSIPSALVAINGVLATFNCELASFTDIVRDLRPPFINFYRDRGVPERYTDAQIWTEYKAKANHHQAEFFGDVHRELSKLTKLGHNLGLLTSQEKCVATKLLQEHDLADHFCKIYTDAMPKHPYLVTLRGFLEQFHGCGESPWYIGDTCDDMRSAKEAGFTPIGIIRHGDVSEISPLLYNAGATRVIKSLADLLIT